MNTVFINGQYLPVSEAKISVLDRSFLFGEGLFESFRSFDGNIPFLKDHLNRLEWSATFLEIPFPSQVDFQKTCEELLNLNGLKDARFKIVLSQGQAVSCECNAPRPPLDSRGGDRGSCCHDQLVIFCDAFDEKKMPPLYRLRTETHLVNDPVPLTAMKTTNYLVKSYARRLAREAGFDDAVLLNAQGNVVETTTANIFWVDQNSKLHTVMSEQGLLDGVLKKNLLQLLRESKLHCAESVIDAEMFSQSREIFVTNSVIGIKPVVAVDSRQISGGEVGAITAMIRDLWKKKYVQT